MTTEVHGTHPINKIWKVFCFDHIVLELTIEPSLGLDNRDVHRPRNFPNHVICQLRPHIKIRVACILNQALQTHHSIHLIHIFIPLSKSVQICNTGWSFRYSFASEKQAGNRDLHYGTYSHTIKLPEGYSLRKRGCWDASLFEIDQRVDSPLPPQPLRLPFLPLQTLSWFSLSILGLGTCWKLLRQLQTSRRLFCFSWWPSVQRFFQKKPWVLQKPWRQLFLRWERAWGKKWRAKRSCNW